MTIAERKARELYDRENPWRPMKDAKPDGTICELLFADMAGSVEIDRRYFLGEDGKWYRIDKPEQARGLWGPKPMSWRPAMPKISPERQSYIISAANRWWRT